MYNLISMIKLPPGYAVSSDWLTGQFKRDMGP